ncbi:hypothetical protein [Fructobacillus evanidus]|uniref:Uncharacterized protein n=2 Tax=Fructobacillus evanidus TaxID=3064281 RepID=A0ABM9MNW6_9LACO|nr:unnamed protein product [Fructobacillus sp. LMG 32999]CAK1221758.1 unnamed protein product [Fructobacillus sp. LMG 32999]CAK1225914.1 unnamed protein product [Fructobacillus sp. LMG 32999]CAK1228272.1 unnamed protein product [Fructobacillus sp. LMG 32999]CAK1228478.1 unnamed protein product [Fructobacillus sp. LMG 32999]
MTVMDELRKVNKVLKITAQKNLKWQILFFLLGIIFSTMVLLPDLSLIISNKMNIVVFLDMALIILEYILLIFWIKFIVQIRKSIRLSFQTDILQLNDMAEVNEWIKKNSFRRIKNLFYSTNRTPYFLWGIIELEKQYRITFVDFSKDNQLIILNVKKQELAQYSEVNNVKKIISKSKVKAKRLRLPVEKQLYSSFGFYIKY